MPRIKTHRRKKASKLQVLGHRGFGTVVAKKTIEKFHPRVHGEGKDKSIALEYKKALKIQKEKIIL